MHVTRHSSYHGCSYPISDVDIYNAHHVHHTQQTRCNAANQIAGGGSPTIDASKLNEDSIPYAEFLEKLNADQVAFVEFLAPNGDAAYATFKTAGEGEKSKPIRIGEGYPIEDPEGWSSPAFVIKAVAKKGVPYKFVVPGLSDSFM